MGLLQGAAIPPCGKTRFAASASARRVSVRSMKFRGRLGSSRWPGRNHLRCCALVVGFGVFCLSIAASPQEDAAADAVATAFVNSRKVAGLPNLERMGRNTFHEKACKHDLRFPSGLINDIVYDTSDPAQLPESAQKLATTSDTYKTAARFAVGVCVKSGASGQPTYSVIVATYESRLTSFFRIFWE